MKFIVQGVPEFRMAITLEDVEILRKVSARHYDAVCREASADDGRGYDPRNRNFLTSWRNQLEFDQKYHEPGDADPTVTATWSNLDCSMKILEQWNWPGVLNDVEKLVAGRIRYDFSQALRAARPMYDQWNIRFDTAEDEHAPGI